MTRNVLFLSIVALCTDAATDLAIPLLPDFLIGLGAGAAALGLIEGFAELTAALLKLFSGRWSDASGQRRPWILGGYLLSSIVRPLLALASTPFHVALVRITDRTGKGLRTSPRDALLAASVPEKYRGAAFGFHQGMDHLGAVLGPALAVLLLLWAHFSVRAIFWMAIIPGALAVTAIIMGVEDEQGDAPREPAPLESLFARPSKALLAFLIPLGIFTLGSSSDLFLLYKARVDDTPLYFLPLLWMGLHLVKAASSEPGGRLADVMGSRLGISLGWAYYALIYAGMAFLPGHNAFLALFLAYGLFYGLTEGAEKALVAKLVPGGKRGAGFGWYYLTVGVLVLPANIFFGWLWDHVSRGAAFYSGSAFALAGLVALWLTPRLMKVRA